MPHVSPTRDPAEDGGGAGVPETCAEARRQIADFVRRSPGPDESRFLRAHLERCPACAEAYHGLLAGAARVGHAVRTERVERTRERRHAEHVRLARGARHATRGNRPWLKLFLATCALFFLFTRLPLLGFGVALTAQRAVGEVVAAGAALAPDARRALVRGDRCATGASARAVLVGDHGEIELLADTGVLIEEPGGKHGPRIRLLHGALALAGPCVVTTELGVVTVASGSARVELVARAAAAGVVSGVELLRVACAEGELEVVGPLGVRRLTGGESATFGLEG